MHHKQIVPNTKVAAGDTFILDKILFVTVAHDDYSGKRCDDCEARPCFRTPDCSEPCCVFKEATEPEELYALLRLKGEI